MNRVDQFERFMSGVVAPHWYVFADRNEAIFYSADSEAKLRYRARMTNLSPLKTGRFARKVAEALYFSYQKGLCDDLTIVAKPRFLGLLQQKMDRAIKKTLLGGKSSDFVGFSAKRKFQQPHEQWKRAS